MVGASPKQNGPGLFGDQGFAGREALAVGPRRPARHLLLGQAEFAQPRQHFQILHRVDIAGDRLREGAHLGAAQRILRQQGRLGLGFLQPFDDGERLGQHRAGIVLQRGNQPLRVDGEKGGIALFALAKMVRQVIGVQPLQIQRDSDPVGRAAAEIAVQLHDEPP